MDVFPIDGLPDNKKEAEDRLMKALNIRKLTDHRSDARIGEGTTKFRSIAKLPVDFTS